LHWQQDGVTTYYKRQEKGTFRRLSARIDALSSELNQGELYLILRGIDLEKPRKENVFYE